MQSFTLPEWIVIAELVFFLIWGGWHLPIEVAWGILKTKPPPGTNRRRNYDPNPKIKNR